MRQVTIVAAMTLAAGLAQAAEPIEGRWKTASGETAVIASCGGSFCVTLKTGKHAGKKIGTVKALRGKGTFDVLEVEGSVYKANYRLRLIFAQIPGSCLLMGQEILERSDPY